MSRLYGAYRFTSKDPEIDMVRTLVEDHFGRRVNRKDLVAIKEAGGPLANTMVGWFFGKTKRPQSASLEAAGRSLGYMRKWVKINGRTK
jgi:hypothetical protein